MQRTIKIELNKVSPIPSSLRLQPLLPHEIPVSQVEVDLGRLFLHHYMDKFGIAPPKPDPTRFEYLDLVGPSSDFRLHRFHPGAPSSTKRTISQEIGQAFCRLLLHDHFGICYFAHLEHVMRRGAHRAFGGIKIERAAKGDTPDYLCARQTTRPMIAEAKGRFSSISFQTKEFDEWRQQFNRIRVLAPQSSVIALKGFIAATRFITDQDRRPGHTTSFIEDPETPGDAPQEGDERPRGLGRVILAQHYAGVFHKIGLSALASALDNGYALTRELSFVVPVWTCMVPPFQGRKFVGGAYRTTSGAAVTLTANGWELPMELPHGHLAFIGLEIGVARQVAEAGRGDWATLDSLDPVALEASGNVSSDFSWLMDGCVSAPVTSFLPSGTVTL